MNLVRPSTPNFFKYLQSEQLYYTHFDTCSKINMSFYIFAKCDLIVGYRRIPTYEELNN
jgi:hypothetical protein